MRISNEINQWKLSDDVPIASGIDIKIERVSKKDIAVIGMAAKFPHADDIEQFWFNLKNGVSCLSKIPDERKKDVERFFRFTNSEKKRVDFEVAAYLDKIDPFDFLFFHLSPKEASLMDPNQRLFLETAWATIENAGYGGEKLTGTRTGVYVGFGGDTEYQRLIHAVDPTALSLSVTGNIPPIIASRISYLLDLKGPSMLVNTVCSSSLVAVHMACLGIRHGECEMALAGGSQLYICPVRETRVGIESTDGITRTFDHNSDGTGSGEGVAAAMLKPLHRAVRDRDHIYAVIKGGAINQDGRSIGISAPNPAAQEDVIVRAWKDAGIDPQTITFIEAHGTGTKLGDPIEIDGITRAFQRYTERKQFCAIGSVKSNMGHLDSSAGIAGFIKAVLALKNREIPPSLHFARPNRKIPFHKSPVFVNDMLMEWETDGFPRRCGVSSFSFCGTNCHLVLEEAPEDESTCKSEDESLEILTLSADTEEGLKRLILKYKDLINNREVNRKNLCYTANNGRGHYKYRVAFVSDGEEEFRQKIADLNIGKFDRDGGHLGSKKDIGKDNPLSNFTEEDLPQEQIIEMNRVVNEKLRQFRLDRKNRDLLYRICQLYTMGAEVDWQEFYRGEKRRRIPLPTYPFESRRCWVNIPPLADKEGLYYTIGWKESILNKDRIGNTKKTALILKDKGTVWPEIASRLRAQNNSVVEVQMGASFTKISDNEYSISGETEDYERLLSEPGLKDLRQVLLFSTVSSEKPADSLGKLMSRLKIGVFRLFSLTKAISSGEISDVEVVLISDYAMEVDRQEPAFNPENAALLGLGKVVNVETNNLKCRAIDIDAATDLSCLHEEILAVHKDYKVAYRSGRRYVEELQQVDLDDLADLVVDIKSTGIYMITGGTGGMGLEIADYLASQSKVNIALVNRSGFPERSEWPAILTDEQLPHLRKKIEIIKRIEKKGGCVICCRADVSSEVEIRGIFEYLRERYGKINGIVHCAGVGSGKQGKMLENDDDIVFGEVLAPKVQGTWLLDKISRPDNLDFFVVFSSPITLTGGRGSGSYTAANAYLDAFAAYRNKSEQRTVAMSWAPWKSTIEKMNIPYHAERHLFEPLSTETIIDVFDRILTKNISLAVIGRLNYQSEIFYLGDHLPIRFSQGIENQLKKSRCETEGNIRKRVDPEEKIVELYGRENQKFTESERRVAQVFGEFLGYTELDLGDNFYELGGDSIIAVKLIHALSGLIEARLEVVDLLKHPTIKEFAGILDQKIAEGSSTGTKYTSIPFSELKEYYPLSSAQKKMHFLQTINPNSKAYNISMAFLIEGELDQEKIEAVFIEIIKRHENFRTSFHIVKDFAVQKIHHKVDFRVRSVRMSEEVSQNIENIVQDFIESFDLSRPPLLRVGMTTFASEKYLLLLDMHHVVADGVSMGLLARDFMHLYNTVPLPPLRIQYRDFAVWQNRLIQTGTFAEQEKFWLNELGGELPVLTLPIDFPRPVWQSFEGRIIRFEIDESISKSLKQTAKQEDTTLYTVLLAIFKVLLAGICGQESIVVGTPVTGRRHKDLQPIIGMFLSTVVLRSRPVGERTFVDYLRELKDITLRAFANQDYPFENLVEKIVEHIDMGRNPLFDVMFIFQNIEIPEIRLDGLKVMPYTFERGSSMVDMTFIGEEIKNRLFFRVEYCTRLFKVETVEKIISIFSRIVRLVAGDVNLKLRDIEIEKLNSNTGRSLFNEIQFDI